MEFLATGSVTMGLLVGGLLGEMLGMRLTLVVAAAGKLSGGLWLIFSPILKIRSMPTEPFQEH